MVSEIVIFGFGITTPHSAFRVSPGMSSSKFKSDLVDSAAKGERR
jgi:hypothetical protein